MSASYRAVPCSDF